MTTYTGAIFNNGIFARFVDLLASARERGESAPFADEIARVNRVLDGAATTRWAMPDASLAALLDLVSEELTASPGRDLPPGFRERLGAAAGELTPAEFLTRAASWVRTSRRAGTVRLDVLPMASWEAELVFAHLRDFSYWVESDEHESFEEGVLAGVTSEHPDGCAHALPPLIAESHAALLLEKDHRSFAGLRSVVSWADPSILREVLRLASAHLLEAH